MRRSFLKTWGNLSGELGVVLGVRVVDVWPSRGDPKGGGQQEIEVSKVRRSDLKSLPLILPLRVADDRRL